MSLRIDNILSGILLSFSFAYAAAPSQALNEDLQNVIQNYLVQKQNSLGISAVQLSVLLPGESEPRDFVVGTQYINEPIPATTKMFMQWGSVTKEYTAALIFQLINQGRLQTTETLGQLFPEQFISINNNSGLPLHSLWPAAWKNVTLIQLMNMTSGIPTYNNVPAFNFNGQYSLEDLVNIAAQYQIQNQCPASECFAAGTTWFYSNTNYILLGMIIEKLTGQSFANAITQNILNEPSIQGDEIYYYPSTYPANIQANMIQGYNYWLSADRTDVTDWNISWLKSAGGLTGNMDSLVRITNTLYQTNDIIPASELEQYAVQRANGQPVTNVTQQCTRGDDYGCYAMGLALFYNADQGGEIWWYEGGTMGYNTIYFWVPSEKVIIAVAQNTSDYNNQSLMDLVFQINTTIREDLSLSSS